MKTQRQPASGRRWLLFGPGTVMALVAALFLIGSGWLTERGRPTDDAGQVVYEADASGHLRRVASPSAPAAPTGPLPRLWKPEVSLLRRHAGELGLSAHQSKSVDELDAAWQRDKASLTEAMAGASAGMDAQARSAEPGHGASVAAIQQGLSDYSTLSREYDARRAGYWARGLASLTGEQRARVQAYQDSSAGASR